MAAGIEHPDGTIEILVKDYSIGAFAKHVEELRKQEQEEEVVVTPIPKVIPPNSEVV